MMQTIAKPRLIYRHRLPVRLMHWINVLCLFILLMSGLTIFNAHPHLYWGRDSHFETPLFSITQQRNDAGELRGVTRIFGHTFDTHGVLGISLNSEGTAYKARSFPSWATIPNTSWLSMARHWHFFFAWLFVINGLAYIAYAIFSGHLRRDMIPTMRELRNIGLSIRDHIKFRHPTGEAASRYNVLQIIAYLLVIFGLLPLVVIAGLGMSPALNAIGNDWIELLGGRQSARTLHFLAALGLVLFIAIHVFEVAISGLWNQMRSMITGYYKLPADKVKANDSEDKP